MASRNRGKRKPKLRDLTIQAPTAEERRALREAISGKEAHPVVVAVLGCAFVEHELDKVLRSRFRRNDDDTWAALTEQTGPFGTFYSKIVAGYAYGTYDEVFRDALHTVRSIRNAFAHSKKMIDFKHSLVVGEMSRIRLPPKSRKLFYLMLDHCKHSGDADACQMGFVNLCLLLGSELLLRQVRAHRSQSYRLRRLLRKTQQGLAAGITQSPYYSPLMTGLGALGTTPLGSTPLGGGLLSGLLSSAENHISDPKTPTPEESQRADSPKDGKVSGKPDK